MWQLTWCPQRKISGGGRWKLMIAALSMGMNLKIHTMQFLDAQRPSPSTTPCESIGDCLMNISSITLARNGYGSRWDRSMSQPYQEF
jgi:hypothetical protein